MAAITAAHPDWVRGTQNDADPWVIAHALEEKRVIITEESDRNSPTLDKNLKIPNVANEHGVSTMRFFEFVEAQGWTF